jgi:ankyrin repeat protein
VLLCAKLVHKSYVYAVALPIPGADATAATPDTQDTALHLCCRQGMSTVVQALLQQGASLNTANVTRQTPVDIAVQCGHMQLAQALHDRSISSSSSVSSSAHRIQQLRDSGVLSHSATVPTTVAAAIDIDASSSSLEYTEAAADEPMQQQELYAQYSAAHAGASDRESSALMAAVMQQDSSSMQYTDEDHYWRSDHSDAGSDTDDNCISGTNGCSVVTRHRTASA